jgi:hypothetical protein
LEPIGISQTADERFHKFSLSIFGNKYEYVLFICLTHIQELYIKKTGVALDIPIMYM